MRKLTLSLTLLILAACGGTESDPEDALREWVARGEVAAEEKDRRGLLDMISKDYADARGNDHERIGNILRAYFLRQQSIVLLTSIDDIILSGSTAARIDLTVGMAGTRNNLPGFNADAYKFELELEKPDDDWLLIGARWSELGGDLH